ASDPARSEGNYASAPGAPGASPSANDVPLPNAIATAFQWLPAQCGNRFNANNPVRQERPMSVARHPRPPELVDVPIEDIMQKYVGRFREKKPDWAAFEDAKIEGYKRAQHRFIGAGGSGKHGDPTIIPANNFTLSIMYVEPGQGNAAHTHEVEECFFV